MDTALPFARGPRNRHRRHPLSRRRRRARVRPPGGRRRRSCHAGDSRRGAGARRRQDRSGARAARSLTSPFIAYRHGMPAPVDEEAWLAIWNSQSAKPILAIADPEIEIHAVTLGIEGRLYTGHEGLRQWMRDLRERYNARSRAEEIEALGADALMVRGTIFLDDGFGGEEEQRFAMVVHLREGKARWIGTFFSATDAREAFKAGVTGPHPG